MSSREEFARSVLSGPVRDARWDAENRRSGLLWLGVVFACLTVIFGLVLFTQRSGQTTVSAPMLVQTPTEVSKPPNIQPSEDEFQIVARAEVSTQAIQPEVNRDITRPISQQIQRPIRLVQDQTKPIALPQLVRETLSHFGHESAGKDVLADLLVVTLSERQSDAYIDAVLNAARIRGDFVPPAALTNSIGKLDTDRLLNMLLSLSQAER